MNKLDLIETAKAIPDVKPEAAAEYEEKRDQMVGLLNEYMLSRGDIHELVGPENLEMMKDNHANHGMFIQSMLAQYNPEVLVETILWVFRAYRSRKFHTNYWAAQLNAWVEVMKKTLSSESFENIFPLYSWMIINIPQFTALTNGESGETTGN